MANLNFDLDRLLTGVSSRPMEVQEQPIPGSSSFSGDFGAQTANSMKASLGKLVRGGRPTQAQQLNQAEAKYIAGGTIEDKKNQLYEANLLSLDCGKAEKILNWKSKLNFNQTAEWTSKWYHSYYAEGPEAAVNLTKKQINDYSND